METNDLIQQVTDTTPLIKLNRLTQQNTTAPTHTPQGFQDQFYFQSGSLWVYMGGTWVQIGGGQYKNGQVAVPSSGNSTVITGIGFRPKLIKATATYNGATSLGTMSVGSYDGTNHYYNYVSSGRSGSGTSFLIYMWDGTNTATRCSVTALSDDGFTIQSPNNSVATTITYECYG